MYASKIFLLLCLFVLSDSLVGSYLFAQQDYTDVRIFQSSNPQTENSIAINPKDPKNILVCTNGSLNNVTRFYSTDEGNSWSGIESNPPGVP